MTIRWWTDYWWWWLLFVAISWFGMEMVAVVCAHIVGDKHIVDWTLSDTIRRWSGRYRWLAPMVVGVTAFLIWHFFVVQNPT
jgi:hypothetical protein